MQCKRPPTQPMAGGTKKVVRFGPGPANHRGPGADAGPCLKAPPEPLPLVPEEQHEPEEPQFFDPLEEPMQDYGPGRGAMNTAWL